MKRSTAFIAVVVVGVIAGVGPVRSTLGQATVAQATPANGTGSQGAEKVYAPGEVNLQSSRVYAFVDKGSMVGHQHAVMGSLQSGRLLLGASGNAGTLVFNMASFDADSPAARKYIGLEGESADWMRSQVNDHMHGEKALDVARFATAAYRVASALPVAQKSPQGRQQ
ncbi:MAG: hypothetical protein AAGG46_09140, partial [Planctomycetota bacterium]